MPTSKHTVSVRLDPDSARRLERAARLLRQSQGAFLSRAGDETARRVLLDWAVLRYRSGERSISELAEESGLAVEEIMGAVGSVDPDGALSTFLANAQTAAELEGDADFLRLAHEAVAQVRTARSAANTASRGSV